MATDVKHDKKKDDDLAPAGQRPDDPAAPSQKFGGLTEEEIAEFRRLRQEDAERNAAVKRQEEEDAKNAPAISHFLHLANGDVVESAGTMTHYQGVPVVGSYPVPEDYNKDREEEKRNA